MAFEDLSPEIQEKLRACETVEELRELAKALGTELSDEELKAVSGGICVQDSSGKICLDCWANTARCPIKGTGSCLELLTCSPWACEELSAPSNPVECPELITIIEKPK